LARLAGNLTKVKKMPKIGVWCHPDTLSVSPLGRMAGSLGNVVGLQIWP
jgi:hypothetical protein